MNTLPVYLRRFGIPPMLAILLFLPWVGTYFVADDWPVIARNIHLSAQDVPRLFTIMHAGWYRPIFELYVGLCWRLFGLNPVGYHLMSIFLYAVTAALVGLIGLQLSGDWRIGTLSGLLFSVLASHAEPVMWISSANELLAGVFTLCSMMTYAAFRKRQRLLWFFVSVLSFVFAVMSKETALFLPVMFLTYDLLFPSMPLDRRRGPRLLLVPASLLVVTGLLAVVRLFAGTPYSVQSSPAQLVKNLGYYLIMQWLLVPGASANTVVSLSLGAAFSLLGIILIAGYLSHRRNSWLCGDTRLRTVLFAGIWMLAALVPTLSIITERTTFLSSCGAAVGVSAFSIYEWDLARRVGGVSGRVVVLAFALFMVVNVASVIYRSWWWAQAGQVSQSTLAELWERTDDLPPGTEVWLVDLPDQLKYAYVFRNAFPAAAELLGFSQEVHAILDSEFERLSQQEKDALLARLKGAQNSTWLRWEQGALIIP